MTDLVLTCVLTTVIVAAVVYAYRTTSRDCYTQDWGRDPKDDLLYFDGDKDAAYSRLLMMGDVPIGLEPHHLDDWTAEECAIASEWAMREMYAASDNDYIVRFPRPAHVAKLGTFDWTQG